LVIKQATKQRNAVPVAGIVTLGGNKSQKSAQQKHGTAWSAMVSGNGNGNGIRTGNGPWSLNFVHHDGPWPAASAPATAHGH